ncbi:hypothetical protein TrispH2_011410 [Trichoplax sp. H2]|nr:hypothetical protein TrispH2_011410 [Trichoplax sp. H2]|eukprot:RDD36520.1 hypothetical protein TrispH2_011410 [Trichoplax sp. H2]
MGSKTFISLIVLQWMWILMQVDCLNETPLHDPTKDARKCLSQCRLSIEDEEATRKTFKAKVSVDTVRVLYFNFLNSTKQPIYSFFHGDNKYAWVKPHYGRSLFAMPMTYVISCFYIPGLFHDYLNVTIEQPWPRCIEEIEPYCREVVIFDVLESLIRIGECSSSQGCETLCRRNFSYSLSHSLLDEKYSCCGPKDFQNDSLLYMNCIEENLRSAQNFITMFYCISVFSAFLTIPVAYYVCSLIIRFSGG